MRVESGMWRVELVVRQDFIIKRIYRKISLEHYCKDATTPHSTLHTEKPQIRKNLIFLILTIDIGVVLCYIIIVLIVVIQLQ